MELINTIFDFTLRFWSFEIPYFRLKMCISPGKCQYAYRVDFVIGWHPLGIKEKANL